LEEKKKKKKPDRKLLMGVERVGQGNSREAKRYEGVIASGEWFRRKRRRKPSDDPNNKTRSLRSGGGEGLL